MIPFPDKKYSVIYADPPWSYSGGGAKRNVTKHYHTMKAKDIYDLPVQDIAADDCLLFMWATIPKRGDVFFCQGSPDAIGREERKTRPVVIIQNDAGNASSPTVIVANMTTNTSRRLYPMQFDIDLPGHSPSRVQCEQIRTVDKCRLRERIYTPTGEELRKLDDCLAVSFGMTRQAAQEAAHSAAEAQDDIFHELTRNGLSVAVCPLPVLNQVNITITDGKTVSMTRNVAPAGGIVSELLDMKDTLKEVTP